MDFTFFGKYLFLLFLIINMNYSLVFSDVVFPDQIDDSLFSKESVTTSDPVLFYLDTSSLGFDNFGDVLSQKIVERILGRKVQVTNDPFIPQKKILALGSIIRFAKSGDIIWGAGVNGRRLDKKHYHFKTLDVRAVRGPLTKQFLENLGIQCPEVYGDPALLLPKYFPEFIKPPTASKDFIVIAHYEDEHLLQGAHNLVSVKEKWDEIIKKIIDSKFVISTSLHGIIVAEAFGIPARLLRVSESEPIFKFADYYYGTNRPNFIFATSVEEALKLGGEKPPECDLKKLSDAFPYECWANIKNEELSFNFEEYIDDFVLETKKIEIPGYPTAFNPSIIRWDDRLLLCFRTRSPVTRSTDKVGFVWLDDNFNLVDEPVLLENRFIHPGRSWMQDPRMIKIQDRYYFIYSDILDDLSVRRMFIAELHFDGKNFYIEKSDILLNCENKLKAIEKNWVPFNYNNSLLLAYSILPHKIVKPLLKTNECKNVAFSESSIKWNWGELRGGTPAYLVGEEYLAFFHSCKMMKVAHSNGNRVLHYFIGAYTFSAKLPFEITRFSAKPIVGKSFYTSTSYKTWVPLRVVYPVSYMFDEKFIWISYGKQDHEIWIAKINKEGLFSSLIRVSLVKPPQS